MALLQQVRERIGEHLRWRSICKHRSRIGWRDAPRYSDYWARCKAAYTGVTPSLSEKVKTAVSEFSATGVTAFSTPNSEAVANSMLARLAARDAAGEKLWADDAEERGQHSYLGDLWHDFPEVESLFRLDLGPFLENYFQAHFKILYGTLYRSVGRADPRIGSQRWHSDSGPGICVNAMFYLHETGPAEGTLEALPWDAALAIYRNEGQEIRRRTPLYPGASRRLVMTEYYDDVVSRDHASRVVNPNGPPGLFVPFLNNTLHRGGYPQVGHTRTAIVFHCYPSHQPTDFALYAKKGIGKTMPYPRDPAEAF